MAPNALTSLRGLKPYLFSQISWALVWVILTSSNPLTSIPGDAALLSTEYDSGRLPDRAYIAQSGRPHRYSFPLWWLERKPVADGYLGSGSSSGGNEKLGATPTNFRFFDPQERRKLSVPS